MDWMKRCVVLPERTEEGETETERQHRGMHLLPKRLNNPLEKEKRNFYVLQVSRADREWERRETEIDRWKKRERVRGWPREFEGSVKGFDCSRQKDGHVGRKWSTNDTKAENDIKLGLNRMVQDMGPNGTHMEKHLGGGAWQEKKRQKGTDRTSKAACRKTVCVQLGGKYSRSLSEDLVCGSLSNQRPTRDVVFENVNLRYQTPRRCG